MQISCSYNEIDIRVGRLHFRTYLDECLQNDGLQPIFLQYSDNDVIACPLYRHNGVSHITDAALLLTVRLSTFIDIEIGEGYCIRRIIFRDFRDQYERMMT